MRDSGTNKVRPSDDVPAGKYISSVKVGAKGQIVIPKEARELFGIKPGDTLLLLADSKRGIAVNRFDYFEKVADEIFLSAGAKKSKNSDEGAVRFAEAIYEVRNGEEEGDI